MKLKSKRGNLHTAKYVVGSGNERQETLIEVGAEPVELSQEHGEFILNLFSKELEIVGNGVSQPEQKVEASAKGTEGKKEKEVPGIPVDFKPTVGDGEESVVPSKKTSARGAKHIERKV